MPDSLKKRGKHPRDESAFHSDCVPLLLDASHDLAWLKTRGYADKSSLKLVGDRYALDARQRTAVARSTCSNAELHSRLERRLAPAEAAGRTIYIDGFNLLTTIEAWLGEGILLIGRDSCMRDMSSMHGNYRMIRDTGRAIEMAHHFLAGYRPEKIHWLLDKPVSNSGRLKTKIQESAAEHCAFPVEVELVADPDPVLKDIELSDNTAIISADSDILNHCGFWLNTARDLIAALPLENRILIDFSA